MDPTIIALVVFAIASRSASRDPRAGRGSGKRWPLAGEALAAGRLMVAKDQPANHQVPPRRLNMPAYAAETAGDPRGGEERRAPPAHPLRCRTRLPNDTHSSERRLDCRKRFQLNGCRSSPEAIIIIITASGRRGPALALRQAQGEALMLSLLIPSLSRDEA